MRSPTFALLLLALLAAVSRAFAYVVGFPVSLEDLSSEADVIFKGEAIATEPVEDEWFKPHTGFAARETTFRVVSIIKGEPVGAYGQIRFRHYEEHAQPGGARFGYEPQWYHFKIGKNYIVFASKTPNGARQVRANHTTKRDLGVLRCLDAKPVTGTKLNEIYSAELLVLRDSAIAADVLYAIEQWDGMSESPERHGTTDFSRIDVLAVVRPLIFRPEPEIAQAAIRLLAAGSPYLSDAMAPFWLGTIGVPNPGLGQLDPGTRNAGGALAWRDLVAIANSQAPPATRALAIRALALVKKAELQQHMRPWLKSPEPSIRAAAVALYSDFAARTKYTHDEFASFARDPAAEVRKWAAYAIGFTQHPDLMPVLTRLLRDEERDVRKAAMESLHSFNPEIPAVADALRADLGNPNSHPLSLLALARPSTGEYLEELARVVEEKPTPADWSGGQIPAFTAWKLLFKHLRAQPAEEIRVGKWDRFLDALEQVGQYSSSEPRDIYAFYVQRGRRERAAKYRAKAIRAASYDLDYFFRQVDERPSHYQGD